MVKMRRRGRWDTRGSYLAVTLNVPKLRIFRLYIALFDPKKFDIAYISHMGKYKF